MYVCLEWHQEPPKTPDWRSAKCVKNVLMPSDLGDAVRLVAFLKKRERVVGTL